MLKKILIAVDGSSYSTNTLRYLGQLFHHLPDIHFHLLSIVPTSSLGSAARDWLSEAELLNTISPATRKMLVSQKKYMQQALDNLKRLGIDEKQVQTSVSLSQRSVADDIIHEARKGKYDALLIGRRGIGKLQEIIMGSVSATILEKCHDVPLWIIDGQVNSCKFLVPVDGTSHSLKAIDHLAFILADNPCAEVTLFYSKAILGSHPTIEPKDFYAIWGEEWCEEHLRRPDSLFHAPQQILLDGGFPAKRIFWLETDMGIDPSRQILRQALIDDFGTIVMGRRGEEVSKGIFRGVSDRVLLMAEGVAIWIIG
ncbi:MAG TPA: universal stress protein [Desulfobulbaceae bacterium]|nr:MAG: universal stress protein [Deltaproteobacteria bacterium RIFOXYD12_FULL_53_23]HCC55589.1 universal stress protein [Desulfobulbaceae bacterium]